MRPTLVSIQCRLAVDAGFRICTVRACGTRYAEYRAAEEASKRVRGRAWAVNQEGRAAVFNKKRTQQKDLWDSIYFQLNGTAPPLQPVAPVRRAVDGKLTTDGKQRAAEFQTLFSELGHAVDPQDPKYNVLRGRRVRAEFERIVTACSAHASFGRLDDPITAAELIAALKQLPRHKAADACGFRSEHIALILEGYERDALPLLPAVTAWVHAFNHIFDTSEVPQEWCRQVIIALHKGHGKPASKVTSYRAITVNATQRNAIVLTKL